MRDYGCQYVVGKTDYNWPIVCGKPKSDVVSTTNLGHKIRYCAEHSDPVDHKGSTHKERTTND